MSGGKYGPLLPRATKVSIQRAIFRSGESADSANRGKQRAGVRAHVAHDLAIERELVGEVVVDHRLVDAGRARDVVDADAVEAAAGEGFCGGHGDGAAGSGGVDPAARAAAARRFASGLGDLGPRAHI